MSDRTKILLSWSSGKDGVWSLRVLRQRQEFDVGGNSQSVKRRDSRVTSGSFLVTRTHISPARTSRVSVRHSAICHFEPVNPKSRLWLRSATSHLRMSDIVASAEAVGLPEQSEFA